MQPLVVPFPAPGPRPLSAPAVPAIPPDIEAEVRRLTAAWRQGDEPWRDVPQEALRLTGAAAAAFAGRRILITGGAGCIGAALARTLLLLAPAAVTAFDKDESALFNLYRAAGEASPRSPRLRLVLGDLRQLPRLRATLRELRPDLIFHAAAHKHVPLLEAQPAEAVENNVLATAGLWHEAARHGVTRLVLVSTDKAVAPASWLGATKRAAEWLVQAPPEGGATLAGAILRLANVLGSRGSVAEIFWNQLRSHQPLTLTHAEMTRYFLTLAQSVALLLRVGAEAGCADLYAPRLAAPIRITDLAAAMAATRAGASPAPNFVRIGPRPGERLEERLLTVAERHRAQAIAGVPLWRVPPLPRHALTAASLVRLRRASARNDVAALGRVLRVTRPAEAP